MLLALYAKEKSDEVSPDVSLCSMVKFELEETTVTTPGAGGGAGGAEGGGVGGGEGGGGDGGGDGGGGDGGGGDGGGGEGGGGEGGGGEGGGGDGGRRVVGHDSWAAAAARVTAAVKRGGFHHQRTSCVRGRTPSQ